MLESAHVDGERSGEEGAGKAPLLVHALTDPDTPATAALLTSLLVIARAVGSLGG
ncbi:MAG: hypothetical protein WAL70_11940 [Aeromicrobium sp.]